MILCHCPFHRLAWGLLLVLCAPGLHAQPFSETKLMPADVVAGESHGAAVAIDGDVAVVGAFRDSDPVTGVGEYGAAYVFRFDGSVWTEEAKLTAPQRDQFDWYGWSVAVDGDVILVGTRNDEDAPSSAGAVYVYRHAGGQWAEEAKLTASDGAGGDHFGRALDIDGDVVVVGSALNEEAGYDRGAAYIYRYAGGQWAEEAKLTASDPGDAAYFGESVSISGPRVLIGAWGDSPVPVGQNAGAAYVFDYDGGQWTEEAKLSALVPRPQAQFGLTVALDGDRALIGAQLDDQLGAGAGAAYVFDYDGGQWTEEAKLLSPEPTGFNLFGSSVALEGTWALLGAENWFPAGEDATGKAYLFTYDALSGVWQEEDGLVPSDAAGGDKFGEAVALSGGVLMVGAPEHDLPAGGAGAAYVYGTPTGTAVEHTLPRTVPHSAALLSEAYPNPFQDQTRLTLQVAQPGPVRASLWDLLGREVGVLHDGPLTAHVPHEITVQSGSLPGGVYVVRVETGAEVQSRMVVLQR